MRQIIKLMQFVDENIIEKTAEKLGSNETIFRESLEKFTETQPEILAYFFSEDTHAFTNPEREWMLFLLLVILESSEPFYKAYEITEQLVLTAEEKNWELLQSSKGKTFRERSDVFFENHPQEDLLAFIEDSVTDDEDGNISKEGREPLFIMLKTIVDVLIGHKL